VLFQLRPGRKELKRQISSSGNYYGGGADTDELPFRDMWKELVRVAEDRSDKLAPLDVGSRNLVDFRLFTVAFPKSAPKLRFVGVLGNFIPYKDKDDLILIPVLVLVVYCCAYFWPGWTRQQCTPSWYRPASLLLTSLYVDSIMSVLMVFATLLNSGEMVQAEIGRINLLVLFFGAGAVTAVNELVTRRSGARPSGVMPAAFALLIHCNLLFPDLRYELFGMKVSNQVVLLVLDGAMPSASYLF